MAAQRKSLGQPLAIRYHCDVYFPSNVGHMCLEFFGQIDTVGVTYHAADQLLQDPRGIIPLPSKAELMNPSNQLVEVYEQRNEFGQRLNIMQKALIRVRNLHDRLDYSYVLAREGFIVSAWANDRDDQHRLTSGLKAYYKPLCNEHGTPIADVFLEAEAA